MRTLHVFVAAAVCALGAPRAWGKCAASHVSVWPEPGTVLPANGLIVVSGMGLAQKTVAEIARQQPALVGGDETVALDVQGAYVGNANTTQVVLRPRRALEVDGRYALELLAPDQGEGAVDLRIWAEGRWHAAAWQVGPPDQRAPVWRSTPRPDGSEETEYGCGPEAFEFFVAEVDDASPQVWFLAEVRRADGAGPLLRQLVATTLVATEPPPQRLLSLWSPPTQRRRVALGHGMCSGAFKLEKGVEYRVSLTALDLAGNASSAAPLTLVRTPTAARRQ